MLYNGQLPSYRFNAHYDTYYTPTRLFKALCTTVNIKPSLYTYLVDVRRHGRADRAVLASHQRLVHRRWSLSRQINYWGVA